MKRLLQSFAVITAFAAATAPVQAACWDAAAFEAAQVRQLETMLTAAAARCETRSPAFAAHYGTFRAVNGAALASAQARLQRHFAGAGEGQVFSASLATQAASAARGLSCDDMAVLARIAADSGGSVEALARFASSADLRPQGGAETCRAEAVPIRIALNASGQ
ncbi:hypothetical protein E2493_13830 [Sphingomonas parva]|uniref:Uncharacterized protein n=1 Tax=Sphingomonas parva TaxID=2555898 RepID=A0A4Y8ZNM2_9SPHN|nr:hypothetical protein [Sphingomonas parva]TFI57601.1 hypothetical protein E2493_13830 [Sphingomonas parva]